jgi:protease I
MANIAVVLAADFEDSEFRIPFDRLKAAGHELTLLGRRAGDTVEGKRHEERATIQATVSERKAEEFDGLLIPGGYSPDKLRTDAGIVQFVQSMAMQHKPIAAVCHGPQLLIEAKLVRGKTLTSWPSVRTDLENAGAAWVDQQVVQDGNLITSRKPEDLEAFSAAFIKALEIGPLSTT